MSDTYLLTWNPKKSHWKDLADDIETIKREGSLYRVGNGWSCGNRQDLPLGSYIFLMRLGKPKKGIVASGVSRSEPEPGAHWDEEKARRGKEALYIDICFDVIEEKPVITLEELQEPPFADFDWTPQSSGILIPDEIATALKAEWSRRKQMKLATPRRRRTGRLGR
jgi:hypothetical protein